METQKCKWWETHRNKEENGRKKTMTMVVPTANTNSIITWRTTLTSVAVFSEMVQSVMVKIAERGMYRPPPMRCRDGDTKMQVVGDTQK